MTDTHPLAVAWLERVERLAADLPPDIRSELLADLREHLDAALPPGADGSAVGAVLDRLGDPADVVAAARSHEVAGAPPPVARASLPTHDELHTQEVVALAALVLAGLVSIFVWPVTIVLWATGIALVAVSGRWRGGEVVAMVLLPVAWALPVLSMVLPAGTSTGTCEVDASGNETCVVEQAGFQGGPWVLVVLVVGLVLLVLGTRWLARAPRGRPARS